MMPAGEYLITDPFNVIDQRIFALIEYNREGVGMYKNNKYAYSEVHNFGEFMASDYSKYTVNSGIFGIFPVACCNKIDKTSDSYKVFDKDFLFMAINGFFKLICHDKTYIHIDTS